MVYDGLVEKIIKERKMSNYYFMFHGLPGSGKSTLARKLAELLDEREMKHVQINRDELRTKEFGEEYHLDTPKFLYEMYITEKVDKITSEAFEARLNIIDDNTNMNTADIKEFRKTIPEHTQLIHIMVDIPLETVKAQNHARAISGGRFAFEKSIDRMHQKAYNHDGSKIDRWRLTEPGEPIMNTVSPEELDRILGIMP